MIKLIFVYEPGLGGEKAFISTTFPKKGYGTITVSVTITVTVHSNIHSFHISQHKTHYKHIRIHHIHIPEN